MTTALIAEDELLMRERLLASLKIAWPELEVTCIAKNGVEALELWRKHKPEVAFLDIRMPGKTGLEVAAEIGDAAHLVFITAYDEYARLRLAREVLGEIRKYFPGEVFQRPIAKNIKLAEAPSYGRTIFEYAPESAGASDYHTVALEIIGQESRDSELAALPRPSAAESKSARAPRAVMLVPKTAPASASANANDCNDLDAHEQDSADAESTRDHYDEARLLRSNELPPLPLDAFEIRPA